MSEAAGFKTGIVLDKSQLIELFPDNSSFKEKLAMPDDAVIRVYSYDIDEIFIQILYYLGNVERVTSSTITERLLHKYKADKQLFPIYMEIFELFVEHNKIMLDDDIRNFTKLMNQEKFIADCVVKYGRTGLNIAAELLRGKSEDMHCKLSSYRRFEWDDAVDLKELFQSESLESKYGEFIDQRFIDFL